MDIEEMLEDKVFTSHKGVAIKVALVSPANWYGYISNDETRVVRWAKSKEEAIEACKKAIGEAS